MPYTVSVAEEHDLDAIRRLHGASWRDAYAPFVPPVALDRLGPEMAARWAVLPTGVICARDGREVVAFARVKARQGWPYLDNLHTAPGLRGRGLGTVLIRAVASRVAAHGGGRLWLTVIADNSAARRFYGRHGGIEGAAMVEAVLGHPVTTRPVIWNHLSPLLAKNEMGGVVRA